MRAPKSETLTLNDDTYASHPGLVLLSQSKLKRLEPDLFPSWWWKVCNAAAWKKLEYFRIHIEEHLNNGDSRAAIVLKTRPLVVAAYTDELDCVALLRFPGELAVEDNLKEGSRLLTVNTYRWREQGIAPDLTFGEGDYKRYGNFAPFIAEFLSDDKEHIEQRKAQIGEDEWQRTWQMANEYVTRCGWIARDGCPSFCDKPAQKAK